jgi:phosphoribosylformylglycinamidine synthase
VYLLGATRDETGGSEYFRYRGARAGKHQELGRPAPFVGNQVPRLDVTATLPLYRALEVAIRAGWVRSVAVPAKGGLGVTLGRMSMAAELGLDVDLAAAGELDAMPPDVALFSESLGRFVVTLPPAHAADFEAHMSGTVCRRLGSVVQSPRLVVRRGAALLVDVEVSSLKVAFKRTLGGAS